MRHPLSQSGFSLIEIIIASIILAIVVGSSLTFMGNTETKDTFGGTVQGSSACLLEANKILANIKEKGQARTRLNFPAAQVAAGTYRFLNNTILDQIGQSTSEFGVPFAHRWPAPAANQIYTAPTAAPTSAFVLRPHLLIMGYMNALQAMYNSNSAGFCSGTGLNSYTDDGGNQNIITANTNPLLNHPTLGNATARLRIQVFNTNSGATSCPGSINIRPQGTQSPTAADLTNNRQRPPPLNANNHPNSNQEEVFDADGAITNGGFLVTARVNYIDRSGQAKSCAVQEKFQYTTQPHNSMTLEFEDIDDATALNNIDDRDNDRAEGINQTIRSTNVDNPPNYPVGGVNRHTFATMGNRPIYYGCSENTITAQQPSTVVLRVTRTRPGSIHMCRNLSQLRPARLSPTADWDYRTNPSAKPGFEFRVNVEVPVTTNPPVFDVNGITNTFYSTELIHPELTYYSRKHQQNNNRFITGLFYPQGSYYCLDEDNCAGGGTTAELVRKALPRFPRGSFRPGGTQGMGITNHYIDVSGDRYYHPLTRTDAVGTLNNATVTTANWVPCERVNNVCGVAVSNPGFRAENGNARDAYEMRFNDLPSGCEVHIQIAEVDAGYNITAATFKEYVQERTPGNWLCRNGDTGNGTFSNKNILGGGAWFFSCSASMPAGASACTSTQPPGTDCCIPFPMFPRNKPMHPD